MQCGMILWLTGHSKSGKTTISKLLYHDLKQTGYNVTRLDSDTLPTGIIKPEAASWEERQRLKNENLIFVSKLLCERGEIVLISSVGRFSQWRDLLRKQVSNYIEVYLKCPLDVRLLRDDTSKYDKHQDYFHIYEEPACADLIIETDLTTPDESKSLILHLLKERGLIDE